MKFDINFAFSLVWKHSNYRLIFSEGWEWTENISDDLQDGFGDFLEELESGTDPRILEQLELPSNWKHLSSGKSTYEWKYVEFDVLEKEHLVQVLPARHTWNDGNSGSSTYIVPADFEVEKWETLSREDKLDAMGLDEDADFSEISNEVTFDYYVIGQVEAVAAIEAGNLE